MIAPGVFAVLTPLIAGFLIGPRCLMGLLAGCIGSAAMLAVMMGNAGGAWDNTKKLCEKLKLKKTEQGKACVIGDTVGDPYKDTSGPSLDILIKLMSMVSLTLSPMVEDNQDWDGWQWGLIPVGIGLLAFVVLVYKGILGWQDPLADLVKKGSSPKGTGGKKQESTSLMTADRRGSSDSNFSGGMQIQSL